MAPRQPRHHPDLQTLHRLPRVRKKLRVAKNHQLKHFQQPSLVPYDELADSEKQYDRNTALETLKVIQSIGCQILPPGFDQRSIDDGDPAKVTALLL
jgi:hypothetical protein